MRIILAVLYTALALTANAALADTSDVEALREGTMKKLIFSDPVPVSEVVFNDVVENSEIWSDTSFSFRDDYDIGENSEDFFDMEGMALERIAEEFAKTLVSRILEAF